MATVTAAERRRIEYVQAQHLALNTRKLYRHGWRGWNRWILSRGGNSLPADAEDVMAFLTERGESVRIGTVLKDWFAIRYYHRQAGEVAALENPALRNTVNGMKRMQANRKQGQAAPLSVDILDRMAVGRVEPKHHALCELLFGGALRTSEAVNLTVGDVERLPNGGGRVYITKSKADQFGEGVYVKLPKRTMVALRPLLDAPADAPLFPTRKRRVATSEWTLVRWLKTAVKAVGENPADFSGHSGRVGCAVHMSQQGFPIDRIMRHGRWKRPETVARYLRNMDDEDEFFDRF